jgi:hypothetical protein
MGGSHSKTKYKTRREVTKKSNIEEYNTATLSRWEEKLSKRLCPIRKWRGKEDLPIPMETIVTTKGDAEYYMYTRSEVDDDDDDDYGDNDDGQGLAQFCDDETIPSGEVYFPTHESDRFGTLVVAWDPDKKISENLSSQRYLLNDKISSKNTFILKTNCIIFQIGFGGEELKEEAGEEEEGGEEILESDPEETEETERQMEEMSLPSLMLEWETNKRSINMKATGKKLVKVDHKAKFDNATLSEKDIFLLNENRKIEFYTFEEIKYCMLTKKLPYINKCISKYHTLNQGKYAKFFVVSK